MWVLIYIQLLFPNTGYYDVDVQILGEYESWVDCFKDREHFVMETTGEYDGYPKPGTQAVCIQTENFIDN